LKLAILGIACFTWRANSKFFFRNSYGEQDSKDGCSPIIVFSPVSRY